MITKKGTISALFLLLMLAVMVDGLAMQSNLVEDITIEMPDTDGEKDAEKKDAEKKEKESESEDYLLSTLHKQSSDYLRIHSLFNHYCARWSNPESEIITPPPELIG